MFPQVKVTAIVLLSILSSIHTRVSHFFYSCHGLKYSSHCSLSDQLITLHLLAEASALTGSLTWTPCFPGRFPDQRPILISVTTLSHTVLFFFTQLTGGHMPLQSTWHEQGPDRKGGDCVPEATPQEQVEMGICTQDRSELEDSVQESRMFRGDHPSRGLHS